jgi:hypothetical protein
MESSLGSGEFLLISFDRKHLIDNFKKMEKDWQEQEMEITVLPGLDAIRCRPHQYLGKLEREDLWLFIT